MAIAVTTAYLQHHKYMSEENVAVQMDQISRFNIICMWYYIISLNVCMGGVVI